MYHYTESGLNNVYLRDGYNTIEIDGEAAVSIHDIVGLHKVISRRIIRKSPSLSGDEIRFLRKEMNLTQSLFASIISVSDDTVLGWENGRTSVSGPADKLIRGVYVDHIDGDGGLRQIIDGMARINNEIIEDMHDMNFEEGVNGVWEEAA